MTLITKFISTAVLAASTALAIPHDEVEPFPETAPLVFRTYKPLLKVHHGCVPFPAVNEWGEVGYVASSHKLEHRKEPGQRAVLF
jgi:hypothetical protein